MGIAQSGDTGGNNIFLPLIMKDSGSLLPIIPETTKVLQDTTTQQLTSISLDGNTYTFSSMTSDLQALKPGDVITGGISPITPGGFLRKVTSISTKNGQVIINTTQAVLDEAIQQGEVNLTESLSPGEIASNTLVDGVALGQPQINGSLDQFNLAMQNVVLYDHDGNPGTTNDQIVANGSITFEPSFNFSMKIQDFQLYHLSSSSTVKATTNLKVSSNQEVDTLSVEKEIAGFQFNPIMVQVGPMPVWITPILSVVVGANGSIHVGVSTEATITSTMTTGAQYANGSWAPIFTNTASSQYKMPTLSTGMGLKSFAGPQLSLLIDGVVGPYGVLEAYSKLNADPLTSPWWTLSGGLTSKAGVKVEIISHVVTEYQTPPLGKEWIITQAGMNQPPNLLTNPFPEDKATGQLLDTTLSWSGDDPDGDAVTYSVYLDANYSNPNTPVSVDQTQTQFSTSSLAADTTYYWKVVAKDAHASTTSGPVWSFTTFRELEKPFIAAGGFHTCVLTQTGKVKCWGNNVFGQLGDGTTIDRNIQVDVIGLTSGVSAIAAGDYHTCVLAATGEVKCWGDNRFGQIGDGTTTDRSTPIDVIGLTTGISAITTGSTHSCALTASGGVKCWGDNDYGQLGDGTTTDHYTPMDVQGLTSGVTAIIAGGFHTCALTASGGVKCWGLNYAGELGDGTTTYRYTPVDVQGLTSGVSVVATRWDHTCALTTSGGVKCWGENGYGQLGDGTTTNSSTPMDVVGLTSGVNAISMGGNHTCALTISGGVKCWGRGSEGQMGDGSTTSRSTPTDISGLTNGISAITAGGGHTCALTTSGGIRCWGSNGYGQLGDGTNTNHYTPVDVQGLTSGISAVVTRWKHTCALTQAGGGKCWGTNDFGQLGDGTIISRSTPVDISGLTSGISAIATGWFHTCALTTSGGVKCWGHGDYLGDGTMNDHSTPVDVIGLTSGVSAIAAGRYHTCALTVSGGVKCWGYNGYGQLGDSTTTYRSTPVNVVGLTSGVNAISAGGDHTCALTASGGVKCWGFNGYGQGGGTITYRSTPANVVGLTSGVSAISAGWDHTCALTTSGGVKCWGYNIFGQLGNGTTTDCSTPVDVVGLTGGVSAVSAGGNHTCALTTSGGVECWGYNSFGQLGDGTTTDRSTPVNVQGLTSEVSTVAPGGLHTCALTTSGGVKCWGSGDYGQLGYGVLWLPVDVIGFP